MTLARICTSLGRLDASVDVMVHHRMGYNKKARWSNLTTTGEACGGKGRRCSREISRDRQSCLFPSRIELRLLGVSRLHSSTLRRIAFFIPVSCHMTHDAHMAGCTVHNMRQGSRLFGTMPIVPGVKSPDDFLKCQLGPDPQVRPLHRLPGS